MTTKKLRTVLLSAGTVLAVGLPVAPTTAVGADLNLANIPLYLGAETPPNILFLLDDSGSMDWEVMTQDLANGGRFTNKNPDGSSGGASGSVQHRGSCGFNSGSHYGYEYAVEFSSNTYGDNGDDCNTADDNAWRFRNSDFNPLYYDPNKTYAPWSGVDSNGNAFTDIDVTNAPDDPYDPESYINLTNSGSNWTGGTGAGVHAALTGGFRYYSWNDLDSDGNFDDGEETEFRVANLTAAQQTNFANWFSYYRSREFVAKAAFGNVIAQGKNVRMGLVTLHDNNSVNTAIAEMNDDETTGAKRALLDELYSFRSSGGTPLRSTANQCGKYLSCETNSLFASCPALSLADGGNCQQNFLIMMTDGLWNGGSPGVGNTDGPGNGNTEFDGGAYADGFSNTLADVAMEYYENDIHTGLPDDLPIVAGVDEAEHQHVVTYGVAFGVNGTLSDNPPNNEDAFAWPQPSANQPTTVDDLRHAGYNGRGLFLSARDPQELIDQLNAAIADIGARTSSASSAAANTGLLGTNAQIYQARFNSGDWSGEFLAYQINLDGTIGSLLGDASDIIDGQNWSSGREILTYQGGGGIKLRWGTLSGANKTLFRTNPDTAVVEDVATGKERMRYIRGKRTNEAVAPYYFRQRSTVLGDLVHSSPIYVGPDSIFPFPDTLENPSGSNSSGDYSTFVTNSIVTRDPMVYVGGNDGFLHGFHGVDGEEKIAYLPGVLLPEITRLTDPAYYHRFYVDGDSNFSDVYYSSAWHTVLVGTLRHGGQGVFALDVTDPANFDEGNASTLVLWEFTDADDVDMGFSYSKVAIVRLANGKWAAVFGNGYNATVADGNASSTGDAVLFVVDIETGAIIKKISTGRGTAEDPTGQARPNGLASPAAVDFDGDYIADLIYAGDLFGNVWKFDVSDADPNNWGVAFTDGAGDPAPLFTAAIAMPSSTEPQPITSRVEVGFHPDGQGVLVYFGTGQYIEVGDHSTSNQVTQTFYAIWDDFPTVGNPPNITRSDLLQQEIVQEELVAIVNSSDSNKAREITQNLISWSSDKGWYIDLYNTNNGSNSITDNEGERVDADALLRSGRIIFSSRVPTGDLCAYGGTAWNFVLDFESGGHLPYTPFDLNVDGEFNPNDYLSAGVPAGAKQGRVGMAYGTTVLAGISGNVEHHYQIGSTGEIDHYEVLGDSGNQGRDSWLQLR